MVKSFHLGEGTGTVGSLCRHRDTIVPACWALWRHHQKEVLEFMYEIPVADPLPLVSMQDGYAVSTMDFRMLHC